MRLCCDARLARELLGWSPRTTLEDLFLDVVRDTEARPGRRARQG